MHCDLHERAFFRQFNRMPDVKGQENISGARWLMCENATVEGQVRPSGSSLLQPVILTRGSVIVALEWSELPHKARLAQALNYTDLIFQSVDPCVNTFDL